MTRAMLRTPWLLNNCLYRSKSLVFKPDTLSAQAYSLKEMPRTKSTTRGIKTGSMIESAETKSTNTGSTVDPEDVARHTKLLKEWWDPNGSMKALHSYNHVRVPFIRQGLLGGDPDCDKKNLQPLKGFNILDVGCGGGILTEPLAVMGATVTGLDASPELIKMASDHSEKMPHKPTYICSTIEEHAETNAEKYDAVVASEIIEHVNNKELFVQSCVKTLKPEGRIFFTTPNRTKAAKLLVIDAAENIFKVVPKGTHQIEKFTTPNELTFLLERNGCHVESVQGLFYSLLNNKWYWTSCLHLVFALQAVKIDKSKPNDVAAFVEKFKESTKTDK